MEVNERHTNQRDATINSESIYAYIIIMRYIMYKLDRGIGLGVRNVTNLRYADDIPVIAGTTYDLTELITKVKRESEDTGLYLNVNKTKMMTTSESDFIIVDDNNIKIVDTFFFLGVLITNDGFTDMELRRRLEMRKCAM